MPFIASPYHIKELEILLKAISVGGLIADETLMQLRRDVRVGDVAQFSIVRAPAPQSSRTPNLQTHCGHL